MHKNSCISIIELLKCLGKTHFDSYGEKIVQYLVNQVERIINKTDDQSIELQGIVLSTICSLFLCMSIEKIDPFIGRVVPALITIQMKIQVNYEDTRYSYLFESWTNLLKVMTAIHEKIKENVYLLLLEGFEYINRHSQQQLASESNSSSVYGCSYERMVKAIKLFCSFSRHSSPSPKSRNQCCTEFRLPL
jgi:hypothetical protein